MPLSSAVLENALREFLDTEYAGFTGFPADDAEVALKWATAIDTYTGSGGNIVPVSTTGAAAFTALQTALLGMSAPGAAIAILDVGLVSYATTLGLGMAPAFVATPPVVVPSVSPPTFASIVVSGLAGASGATQANLIASWLDAWFRTGTATPSAGGSPIPWA